MKKQLIFTTTLFLLFSVLTLCTASPALARDFPDLQGHWAATEINDAAQKGIVGGYPDGNFYPNKDISRRELTAMVFSVFPAAKQIDHQQVATYPDYPDLHSGWGLDNLKTG